MNKRCTKCGQFKSTEDFPINKQTKDGFHSWCKECKCESEHNRTQQRLFRPRVCKACLKSEPEVTFSSRFKHLCEACKEESQVKEREARRVKTKQCRICGKQLSLENFTSSQCKICNSCSSITKTEQKELLDKWAKKRVLDRGHRLEAKLELINKRGGACVDCGLVPSEEWPLACFDFHHIENKDGLISKLMHAKKSRKETLDKELEKCIVLCSNCHRKRHFIEVEKRHES